MRWLVVWVFLAGVYLAGQLFVSRLFGGRWEYTWEDLAHLAVVPVIQVAALWIVTLVRREARK